MSGTTIPPHLLTVASMNLQGCQGEELVLREWRCGCVERKGLWWLCQYHQGFDDGAEQALLAGAE